MFDGSPSSIITLGLGTGAGFDGDIALVLTLGLGSGEEVVDVSGNYGWIEYEVSGRLHYEVSGKLHYEVEG